MILKVFDTFIAEGTEIELAMYTHILVEAFRMKSEHDKEKAAKEWMEKYGKMTFEELMRREREDEE